MTVIETTHDIGEVVDRTGVPTTTLHVWEREGLITPVGRTGLRRQYGPEIFDRIALIVISQRSGFTLAEIAGLLDPATWRDGKGALEAKLDELKERRRELDRAITGLEHALACRHPSPLECPDFTAGLQDVLPVGQRQS